MKIASWHWKWSLTWRWILSYKIKRNKYHFGFYKHINHQGKGLMCGLNAGYLGSIHFQLQPNMPYKLLNKGYILPMRY